MTAIGHALSLEDELTVVYQQINGLAEQAARFANSYDTLIGRHAGQPAEAKGIFGILKQKPTLWVTPLIGINAHRRFTIISPMRPGDSGDSLLSAPEHLAIQGSPVTTGITLISRNVDVAGDLEKAYMMNAFADHP
ncbi:hypothetical protein F5144DRAFT_551352 [Chaetomium tenue]|uniref:Uncharacterized protein n=1 Tax=Chaetomium tenue TaxID=1854479 RepID=A0ACB7P216_9PEZI|nr:hypothetical protein F5144DRAFT_551352 [Chaetomium globosum]